MKIAHISSKKWHPCYWDLVLEQNKQHDLHYIYLDLCDNPDYSLKSSHEAHGILYDTITCQNYVNYENDNKLREILHALFKEDRPDILHIQLFSGISLKTILNVASNLGIRTVLTLHDHCLSCLKGTMFDGKKNCGSKRLHKCNCLEQKKFAHLSKQPLSVYNAWRLKNVSELITMCDTIICPSSHQKKTLEALIGSKQKIIALTYGVHLNMPSGLPKNKKSDPGLVFGYLGSLSPMKGFPDVIKTMKLLKKFPFKMLLGIQTKKYDKTDSRLLTQLKNEPKVKILERIRHKALYEKFFSKIDCLIVPSRWQETGPMTLLEALSCKIPVIIANQASMTEKTQGYPNVFVFNDKKELADIMRKILEGKIVFKKTDKAFVSNIKDYAAEIDKIYTQALQKDYKMLVLNTGYLCNNHCIFCVTGDNLPKQFVDLAILKKNLIELRGRYDQLTFTGGEPTLRKDFFDLLEMAYQLGYRMSLQTNGRIFSDKEICKKIVPYNVTVYTHLESYKPKIHDAITNIRGSYWETLKAIKNLKSTKHTVYCKIMLTKFNYRQISLTAKLINHLQADGLWIVSLCPDGYADIFFNQITPKYSETQKIVHKTLDWVQKKTMMKIKLEGFPPCLLSPKLRKHTLEYNVSDRKKRLCIYPLEKKQEEAENFSLEKRLELKQKVAQCAQCALDGSCEGAYKSYVKRFGDKEFKPCA